MVPKVTEVSISPVDPDKCELIVDLNTTGTGDNTLDYSTTLTSSKLQISTISDNIMFSKSVSAVWQVVEHY